MLSDAKRIGRAVKAGIVACWWRERRKNGCTGYMLVLPDGRRKLVKVSEIASELAALAGKEPK